jgi:Cu+-exporting ATPase
MTVDPAKSKGGSHEHSGTTYYFCCAGCREKFAGDPGGWLERGPGGMDQGAQPLMVSLGGLKKTRKPAGPPASTASGHAASGAAPDAEYTCPMHPEIVQVGPGDCPICGMALEPMTVTLEEPENEELVDMTRRFWIAVTLALPVLAIAMGEMAGIGALERLPARTLVWIQFVLATPVCTWAAWPFYVRGVASVRRMNLNMFTLIGIGVSVAYVYSLVPPTARSTSTSRQRQ